MVNVSCWSHGSYFPVVEGKEADTIPHSEEETHTMIKYSEYEQEAISIALTAIQQKLVNSNVMNSPVEVRNYLK